MEETYDKDSKAAQMNRVVTIVSEMVPNGEVVFDPELESNGSMIRYRIDDRSSGKVLALSGYDLSSVIADWSDDELRQRVTHHLALKSGKSAT